MLPALIDLQTKLELERKHWCYKILSPIQKNLRALIGKPPLTPEQMTVSALTLGADVAMSLSNDLRQIENLKQEAGLTFLLEADNLFSELDGK